ncbi:hypothetical protein [Streptomyces phytophilus]|nr:hypothetical protein [Streptomyces phytophilus]
MTGNDHEREHRRQWLVIGLLALTTVLLSAAANLLVLSLLL